MSDAAPPAAGLARFHGGPLDGSTLGIAVWPPPETIQINDRSGLHGEARSLGLYDRGTMSALTDADVAAAPGVIRGAEYHWRKDGEQ